MHSLRVRKASQRRNSHGTTFLNRSSLRKASKKVVSSKIQGQPKFNRRSPEVADAVDGPQQPPASSETEQANAFTEAFQRSETNLNEQPVQSISAIATSHDDVQTENGARHPGCQVSVDMEITYV